MSDQVQLSAYSEAIENLIRSEQHDQAIALCQHILCYYPKNLVTYRQMGVANLEKGDLHSAGELFRRVLSADPEDYVPYAGLAIIFERQALIDEAVWHLERAFELKPGNPEIRKELLRLYGERDGRALTRLRLTPGALARFYAREGLFAQAIQEFNAILSQAPRRQDARLALAETMWHAGQMRDSTQVCQEILQALPHCLKANLILGKAFQESGADQAEPYLRRAQALDPTNRVAQQMFGEQSPLDVAEPLVPQYAERSAPAPAVEAALAETGQARAESFDEWFAEEPAKSGLGGPAAPKESPIEGISTTRPPAPFEHWPPVQEEQAQVPPQEDAQSFSSSWVSQIQVSPEPTEFASAESPSAESPAIETSNQPSPAAEQARLATQPRSPAPPSELPPWLLSDFGLAAPSPAAPKPTVSSASSLPPWLTEFQKTHEVDKSAEPATREAKPEIPEPLPEWTMEPLESTETAAPSPSAEEQTKNDQPWPSWEPVPPQAAEEASRSPELPGSTDRLSAEQTVLAPEPMATKVPSEPAASRETGSAVEEEKQFELPDWLATTRVPDNVAETDTTLPPATEAETHPPIPDWLQGLRDAIPPEPASLAEEGRAKPRTGEEEEQPSATRTQDELEAETQTETEAGSPMPHEELAAEGGSSTESGIYLREEETPEGGVQAMQVTQTAEGEPEGESEPILLVEEPADRELYGDQTAAPAPALEAAEEPAAGETEPAPAQANAPEESTASESLRRRRDPKGYSHLVQARAHCQDNRLGEALKEYDYLVQHSPRLVSAVIEDLEELVRRLDVPLEAHRILGDAYTRADRLADALERYRFVLERVS